MHFFEISEFPFHGGHNHSDYPGEWDDRQVMAGYPLIVDDTIYLYYRGTDDLLPVNGGSGVVSIGVMSAPVVGMNAYNWNKRREINPIIRYDSYGPAVTGTGSMLSDGSGYEGGSPVWIAASAAPVLGGDFNDHAAVVFGSEVFLYVSIVGNPSGTRVVLYKAPVSNPVDFVYHDEITFGGGNFGSTPACIYNVNGHLWMVCGRNVVGKGFTKILRGSPDGITWTDYGDCMPLSATSGQIDFYSQIVGRGFESPNYVYALIPSQPEYGNPAFTDWPEGIVLWRCAKADLGRDSFTWERWGLVALRGPTMGGLWQLAPLNLAEEIWATAQMWGLVGHDTINSTNMNSLRTTEYAGLTEDGGWSTKHQWSFIAGSFSAYTDFDRDPVPAGQYLIRHTQTGNYLAATPEEDSPVVLRDRNIGANNIWILDRELTDFHRISHAASGAAGTRILRPDGTGSLRGTNLGMKIEAAPTAINNFAGQWFVKVIEDQPAGQPIRVAIQNRNSSLCLTARRGNDVSGVALVQQPMLWNDLAFEFELIPVIPAGTEVDVIDSDFPMAIGAGDIVTTEATQTLTNKTITGGVVAPLGFNGVPVNVLSVRRVTPFDFGAVGDGVTDDTAAFVLAETYVKTFTPDLPIDLMGRNFAISKPIRLNAAGMSLMNGTLTLRFDFTASVSGSLAAVEYSSRCLISNVTVNCGRYGNGFQNVGSGFFSTIDNCEIDDFLTFGILADAGGGITVSNCKITQSSTTAANRTGVGLDVQTADMKVFNNIIRFCAIGMRVNGNTLLAGGNHFYNGNATIVGDLPPPNSINIEFVGGSGSQISNTYLDKGRIVLRNTFNVQFLGLKLLFDTVPVHDSVFLLDAVNATINTWPRNLIIQGVTSTTPIDAGDMDFLELTASGTGSWNANVSAAVTRANALLSTITVDGGREARLLDRDLFEVHTKTNIIQKHIVPGATEPQEVRQRFGPALLEWFASGFTQRVASNAGSSSGKISIEGSRTGAADAAVLELRDRAGTTFDEGTPDTDHEVYRFKLVGSGTAAKPLILTRSMAGSATETEIARFDGNGFTSALPVVFPSYTVAAANALTDMAGATVFITNESGGAVLATNDGTDWRRSTDRAVIS